MSTPIEFSRGIRVGNVVLAALHMSPGDDYEEIARVVAIRKWADNRVRFLLESGREGVRAWVDRDDIVRKETEREWDRAVSG